MIIGGRMGKLAIASVGVSIVFLLISCGQIGENYPTGITGGGGGNGALDDAVIQAGIDTRLLGTWWADTPYEASYELTFHSNGICDFKEYWIGRLQDSSSGAWQADGTRFFIDIDGFGNEWKRYWVNPSTLIADFPWRLTYQGIR
jgi:hypothetical protein